MPALSGDPTDKCKADRQRAAGAVYNAAMSQPKQGGTTLATLVSDMWRGRRNEYFLQSKPRIYMAFAAALAFTGLYATVYVLEGFSFGRIAFLIGVIWAQVINGLASLRGMVDSHNVERVILRINIGGITAVFLLCAATGGIVSPFVVGFPATIVPAALMLGGTRATRMLIVMLLGMLVSLLVFPPWVTGPEMSFTGRAAISILAVTWSLFLITNYTGWFGSATREAAVALDSLREERLTTAMTQLRRLQSVGAKVAHELKNPLAAVKGLVQLISRSPANDRTSERLAVVEGEIARMETILHQYLTFSRPLEDLAPRKIDLVEVADDVHAVLSGRALNAEVKLATAGNQARIIGDPRRLKEALLNLVANAIEATPAGGQVTISVQPDGDGARLEVKDDGRGIAPENMSRVGTSFFTTRDSGTGLGFVLARNVVEQHGGRLELASELGKGTTVTITLPAAPPQEKLEVSHG